MFDALRGCFIETDSFAFAFGDDGAFNVRWQIAAGDRLELSGSLGSGKSVITGNPGSTAPRGIRETIYTWMRWLLAGMAGMARFLGSHAEWVF